MKEGNPVANYPSGKTLNECKRLCITNPECLSFAFGNSTGACYLKDQCIESEETNGAAGYITYYRGCGKTVNIFELRWNRIKLKFCYKQINECSTIYLPITLNHFQFCYDFILQ